MVVTNEEVRMKPIKCRIRLFYPPPTNLSFLALDRLCYRRLIIFETKFNGPTHSVGQFRADRLRVSGMQELNVFLWLHPCPALHPEILTLTAYAIKFVTGLTDFEGAFPWKRHCALFFFPTYFFCHTEEKRAGKFFLHFNGEAISWARVVRLAVFF